MHSNRMRTGCSVTICLSLLPQGGEGVPKKIKNKIKNKSKTNFVGVTPPGPYTLDHTPLGPYHPPDHAPQTTAPPDQTPPSLWTTPPPLLTTHPPQTTPPGLSTPWGLSTPLGLSTPPGTKYIPLGLSTPPCGQTDTCKNITLATTSLRPVKIASQRD